MKGFKVQHFRGCHWILVKVQNFTCYFTEEKKYHLKGKEKKKTGMEVDMLTCKK